ncbi:uncharacterized protein isoform X1 [Leptinotarsa decemlineata]|uniref:uncharacterized protein isoform X1 n=2 Tax=Leptinotarsa decemlineata TaxID=7539 RepID=UPI003D308DDF
MNFEQCIFWFTVCFLFSSSSWRAEGIDIECIPAEDCPLAMKLVSTKKFAPETVRFLKNSHCGYSETNSPLVWCPSLNFCTTPDGRNGTCTNIVDCQYLLNTATTTNFIKDYRCHRYLRNRVHVCCPQESHEMENRFMENDDSDDYIEQEEPYIFDNPTGFPARPPSLDTPNFISDRREEENSSEDQLSSSTHAKHFTNGGHTSFSRNHQPLFHRHLHSYYHNHMIKNRLEEDEYYDRDEKRATIGDAAADDVLRNHIRGDDYADYSSTKYSGNDFQTKRPSTSEIYSNVDEFQSPSGIHISQPKKRDFTTTPTIIPSPTQTNFRSWKTSGQRENKSEDRDLSRTSVLEKFSSICGRQTANSDKIMGGTTSDLGEYPWMALLQYTSNQGKKFGCGGTLISNRHILTAAHCVNRNILRAKRLELYKVILGEYDTRNETDCIYLPFGKKCADPSKVYGIGSVVEHKEFDGVNGTDDIALIVLDREVEFTDYVKPICFPFDTITMKTNESLTVAGWGRTTSTDSSSPILKKATLPNVDKEDCNQYGKFLTQGQICAGFGNGVDTCTGDSGGPLMLLRAQNFEFITYQIGIVSYGFVAEECGSAPSVNTFVPYYMDWIRRNIR